ncbi:hypothetical protein [Plantibacter sp. ME-Dv--P-122b]|uniref:hypothetical protein n=1 Tax=Plantibacter sp. ME-Dv--P-122b TaxID=3040300 RepID=UPI00254FB51A|nr:hypothetical protein [Plantibacter sp. ME-Dv--P-122b]
MTVGTRHRGDERRALGSRVIASCVAVVIALSGCTTAGPPVPRATRAASADDLVIEFRQNRDQVASDAAIVRIGNGGDHDITIVGLELSGSAFTAPTVRDRSSTIRAGQTTDLAVELPPIDCDARDGDVQVDLQLRLDDGSVLTASELSDPTNALQRIHTATCTVAAVQRIAEVAAVPGIRLEGAGATTVAVLTISVVPTGAPGRLLLVALRSTVLLQPAPSDIGGAPPEAWPLSLTVDPASGPQSIELRIVPTRCDPHALAEDKVGTLFPLVVRIDDGPETVMTLPLGAGTAEALKDAVRARCA